jgi:5-methylcytosine-specific restriction protein A
MSRLTTLRQRLAPQRASAWDHGGKTAKERGYGWEWTKLRDRIMTRDCGMCQQCRRNGLLRQADQVDHITPKAMGGSDDHGNLEAICGPCHTAKTQAESGASRSYG